jgi:hypothetical protein
VARTVTLAQLRTRARQLANFEGATTFLPDADVTERVNTHITEEYDLLIQAAPPSYYSSTTTISVVSGTTAYSLPADFLSLQGVYLVEGNGQVRELMPMRGGERPYFTAPGGSYSVTVEYTPTPTALSSDSDTFDGVNGWDELVASLVARDMLIKARESVEQIQLKIGELRARIRTMGNRDRGKPRYIRDADQADTRAGRNAYYAIGAIGAYRLRAGNIEFYQPIVSFL